MCFQLVRFDLVICEHKDQRYINDKWQTCPVFFHKLKLRLGRNFLLAEVCLLKNLNLCDETDKYKHAYYDCSLGPFIRRLPNPNAMVTN